MYAIPSWLKYGSRGKTSIASWAPVEGDPSIILQGMVAGCCDLGILLDPFFIHIPSQMEVPSWYPGLGCKHKNIPNLISSLSQLDAAEPWRTQYRSSIAEHPKLTIPRFPGKFFPA